MSKINDITIIKGKNLNQLQSDIKNDKEYIEAKVCLDEINNNEYDFKKVYLCDRVLKIKTKL